MTDRPVVPDVMGLTPVELVGNVYLKRDDLFEVPTLGICGGKARACWVLSRGAKGLVTGCSRLSPQQQLVSRIAKYLRVPCHVHTALGEYTDEMKDAARQGANIFQHYNGFSATLSSKARREALLLGWTHIPFGMESDTAVNCTRRQVRNIPKDVKRIVVVIGSGISVSGILYGLADRKLDIPVLGVRVGGGFSGTRIVRRLNRFAPWGWDEQLSIVQARVPYEAALEASAGPVAVDSHYEAKAIEFLKPGDLFWIVGRRPIKQE